MADEIPEFRKPSSGLSAMSAFAPGGGARSRAELAGIIGTAVMVVGGLELALRWFQVPAYILPISCPRPRRYLRPCSRSFR